jgi:deoxyribodipyrimidine photo-lyase
MVEKRARLIKDGAERQGPVIYWMSRDQRARDNWALLYAQGLAIGKKAPVAVVFCLAPYFLNAAIRQYGFMLRGLEDTEKELARKNILLYMLKNHPGKEIPRFARAHHVSAIVSDFDPLRVKKEWKKSVAENTGVPFYEVDAHNIVPCFLASDRQEYAAFTFRPRLKKMLPEFLKEFPPLKRHAFDWKGRKPQTPWSALRKNLAVQRGVPEVDWLMPGPASARRALKHFIREGLGTYAEKRNDPGLRGQSDLSPYLHFGQLSAQRVALEVIKTSGVSTESFLEELIIRRELSDNFCHYNPFYDSFDGFPAWAKDTLNRHRKDRRPHVYTFEEFEMARTHDELWNAAQTEMALRGKMHGYMRMYWAKKILEWSKTPESALETAILLNDRYELDGRDPNGYAGIAWSIGGVHDRAWGERPVFGKIRYMSQGGARAKFNVRAYIEYVRSLNK